MPNRVHTNRHTYVYICAQSITFGVCSSIAMGGTQKTLFPKVCRKKKNHALEEKMYSFIAMLPLA